MLTEEEDTVECVSIIRAIMDKSSHDHERQHCFEKIEELKEGDPANYVPVAFKLLNEASDISHVGCNIIEHVIRYKWNDITPGTRHIIRNGVLQYISEGKYSLTSENLPTKAFMSRNLVSVMEKEWPQNWPELLNQFKDIILNATLHSQAQMIFVILKRLIENVITHENISNILRQKELSTAINMMMPDMLAVTIDRIQMCIEAGNNDNSTFVAKSAIELLSESVDWVDGRVLESTVNRMVDVLCAYLQVESHGINKSAVTCLFKIASRKQSNPDETSIIVSMFKDDPMKSIIAAANLAAGVSASSAGHYNYFKVLCNLLRALGIRLSEIWTYITKPPPNFALYLSAIYSFFTHPSMCIRSDVLQVLVVFANHKQICKTKEFIDVAKQVIPHIPKNIENMAFLDDTSSVTSFFAPIYCGDDVEFQREVILLSELILRFMRETLDTDHIEQYLQQLNEWINRIILQSDSISGNDWDGLKRYVTVFIAVAYQKELVTNDVDAKFVTMFTSIMNKLETVDNAKTANLMLSISSLFLQLFENHSELFTIYNERSKQIERIYSLSLQADESLVDFSNEQNAPLNRTSKFMTSLPEFQVNQDFEFPRQSENNEPSTPEVMQFKSSQMLRNQDPKENSEVNDTAPPSSTRPKRNMPRPDYKETKPRYPNLETETQKQKNRLAYQKRLEREKNDAEKGPAKNQRAASPNNHPEEEPFSPSDFDSVELTVPKPIRAAHIVHLPEMPFSYFDKVGDFPSVDSNEVSDLSSGESNYSSDSSMDDSSNSSCSEVKYLDYISKGPSTLSEEDSRKYVSYPDKIYRDFEKYWAEIVALKQVRKDIYRELVKQLNKEKKYSGPETNEINVYISLIEAFLNMYIPVAGRIKAKFVHGNKDVIVKRGFKYVRSHSKSNVFVCPYELPGFPRQCSSTIFIDENGFLTPKSVFDHHHPCATFNSEDDDPIPEPKPLTLIRVSSQEPPNSKNYSKMIIWLRDVIVKVVYWTLRVQRCYNNGKIFKELLAKMVSVDTKLFNESFTLYYKVMISETNYLMERIKIHRSLPNFSEKEPES